MVEYVDLIGAYTAIEFAWLCVKIFVIVLIISGVKLLYDFINKSPGENDQP